ncbi:SEL1-like repeat protein, partial [Escherichia coli]|nr:SEL1-like repeat protein [Escherichia coli]
QLGTMYRDGKGIRQNHSLAKEWFGKACDNGDQSGCDRYSELNLGKF